MQIPLSARIALGQVRHGPVEARRLAFLRAQRESEEGIDGARAGVGAVPPGESAGERAGVGAQSESGVETAAGPPETGAAPEGAAEEVSEVVVPGREIAEDAAV